MFHKAYQFLCIRCTANQKASRPNIVSRSNTSCLPTPIPGHLTNPKLPRWNHKLPRWDTKLPKWDTKLPKWDTKLPK